MPLITAVSVSVAVWTLVAISLERYFAICRPLTSRRWQTQFHAYKMIAVVWALSFLVNSPLCYVQRLQPVGQRGGNANTTSIIVVDPPMKCREMWPDKSYERAYVLFLDTGLLILPLLTMGFAYSMIVSKLWRGLRREMKNSVFQRHQREYNKRCISHKSFTSSITLEMVLGTVQLKYELYTFITVAMARFAPRVARCSQKNRNYSKAQEAHVQD